MEVPDREDTDGSGDIFLATLRTIAQVFLGVGRGEKGTELGGQARRSTH